MTLNNEVIYIACPYSHRTKAVRTRRVRAATAWASHMLKQTPCPIVFSPLTHSHPISLWGNHRGDFKFWQTQDLFFLQHCTTLHVLCIPGWDKSIGVTKEIEMAKHHRKHIIYIPHTKIYHVLSKGPSK